MARYPRGVETAEEQLRTASLRVTRQRVAVLDAVGAHPHSDTDTLVRAVRVELPEVSTQAVYDVLRVLTTHEIVRRFEPAGQPARYEINTGDPSREASAFADPRRGSIGQRSWRIFSF